MPGSEQKDRNDDGREPATDPFESRLQNAPVDELLRESSNEEGKNQAGRKANRQLSTGKTGGPLNNQVESTLQEIQAEAREKAESQDDDAPR